MATGTVKLPKGSSFEDLILEFKKLKPQHIINDDDPRFLQIGFLAVKDDIRICVSLVDFKVWKNTSAACQTEEGRKAYIDIIKKEAWGITHTYKDELSKDDLLEMIYDANKNKPTSIPLKELLYLYKVKTGRDHPGFMK